jgi:metallo-beta-lactamase class B
VKVFDNLYFVGTAGVSSWAVKTADGIILIDALNNGREAETYIVGGLRKLGMDPSQIKYLIITHSHADHYGGARYLVDHFHPHVAMSDADWKGVEGPLQFDNPNWDPPPKRDLTVSDGEKITLGAEAVTVYVTPGHTLGTLSLLIPVTDHGQPHMVALWGGTAFNFKPEVDRFNIYAASAERFAAVARATGADVPLSNHPFVDATASKVARLEGRGAGDSHPFVMGTSAETRFLTTLAECAKANAEALKR